MKTFSLFALPDRNTRGLGEFETVMQTRDEAQGSHTFRDFSQPLWVFLSGYANTIESFFIALIK